MRLPTFTAIACNVPMVLLEVDVDGRAIRVSHDLAFQPMLTPCLLRRALTDPTATWVDRVTDVRLLGPFVDIDDERADRGCPIAHWECSEHAHAAMAVRSEGAAISRVLREFAPLGVDTSCIEGIVRIDPELGTTSVLLSVDHSAGIDLRSVARGARDLVLHAAYVGEAWPHWPNPAADSSTIVGG